MIRVLFVCLGNICRSPMADAVFQHQVRQAGLTDQIDSDSAGTGNWHVGEPPHHGTRRLLREKQIDYSHCARQLQPEDFDRFDYILTMDEANFLQAGRVGQGRAQLQRLLDYAPDASVTEVPDPYYTGNFEEVYDLVHTASANLLAAIRHAHRL